MPLDFDVYDLGDVRLQRGATLRAAKIAYKTFGTLNAEKSNAIVYPNARPCRPSVSRNLANRR